MGRRPVLVRLWVERDNAPYIITKPLHRSQEVEQQCDDGIIIRIRVIPNFELEKEILSYGDRMIVLSPEHLRRTIAARYRIATERIQQMNNAAEI